MIFEKFFRQVAGQPIKASTINAPLNALETALQIGGTGSINVGQSPMGTFISSSALPPLWVSITSGTGLGPYAFVEQVPASGGGWTTGYVTDDSGADPAWNTLNFTPASLPIIVELKRDTAGINRFTAGSC